MNALGRPIFANPVVFPLCYSVDGTVIAKYYVVNYDGMTRETILHFRYESGL